MKIVVLGGPGAGKGTQVARLSKRLGIVHISTGDIFRENIFGNTELGKVANTYISKGHLVPDLLTCDMVRERLSKDDCKSGYALDGFPRTIEQAKFFDSYLKERNEKFDAVVNIRIEDVSVIIERLGGRRTCLNCGATYHTKINKPKKEGICDVCQSELIQRRDDSADTIENRLEVYHKQTKPLIEYYKKRGMLIEIDGNGSADEVEERILGILDI